MLALLQSKWAAIEAMAKRAARGVTTDSRDEFEVASIRDGDKVADAIEEHNSNALRIQMGFKLPGLTVARVRSLARQSVATINGIARMVAQRVEHAVRMAVASGSRGEAIQDTIQRELKVSAKKAKRLAVGQVIRANAILTEERHTEIGVTEYTWHAVNDLHSRKWHKALHGTRQRYDRPPIGGGAGPKDRGNPGSADVCRCQAIPVIPRRKR